jgi:serine/threonine-protein kinase
MGEAERSREAYESALQILEQALEKEPDDPRLRASLGITYAALGRKDEAIREGLRAVELFSLSRDAFYGIPYVVDLAFIYTLVDEPDSACDQLEILLTVPSYVSRPFLRVDPRWDRLRELPRFKSLLETQSSPAVAS